MTKQVWSPNRPKKPTVDPVYLQIKALLERDNRSNFAKANVCGLSPSTLRNWESGKVKRPESVSLQMVARMFGYDFRLVKK